MRSHHPLLQRLGIAPIIQAPMAGVATPVLVAAVCNAGALGFLGLGASSVAQARAAIRATRALTRRPFGVNVFCHAPARRDSAREAAWLRHLDPLFAQCGSAPPEKLDEIYTSFVADEASFAMLLDERPAVVSFHFGLPPAERIRALQAAGCVIFATATSRDEARAIAAAGADAVVAQGIEAGGHRGVFDPEAYDEALPTHALVRQLAQQGALPVIAAGGIMDGAAIRAVLDLGACAAQLGTAFILCPQSSADAAWRARLHNARADSTRLTTVLSGRPARGLVNRLMRHGEAPGAPPPADYPLAYDAAKQLHALARQSGNSAWAAEYAAHWAGQGAPLARALPAAELVAQLRREMGEMGAD